MAFIDWWRNETALSNKRLDRTVYQLGSKERGLRRPIAAGECPAFGGTFLISGFSIEEGHAAVHSTIFRNSVQRERLEELTFVGPNAAVVGFYSTLTGDERSPEKVVRSRKILIVTRRAGHLENWLGQNTRLADTTPD